MMIHNFFYLLIYPFKEERLEVSQKTKMCAHFVKMARSTCDTVRLISVKIGLKMGESLLTPV